MKQKLSAPAAAVKTGKDDVNWLNIGLMIAACGAAIAAPFQVFLCAWAILGPMHYLTEISWLHDRNYFTKQNLARRWWLGLVAFAVLTIGFAYAANDPMQRTIPVPFQVALIYLVFAAAAAAIFVRDWLNAVGLFLILSLGLFYFSSFQNYAVAANLLVTIVHVFFFTGAFILLGALKSKSTVGILSLGVFVCCAIATMAVTAPYAVPSERVRQLYTSFQYLNQELLRIAGRPQGVYEAAGVGVMRLIAFAYLYHYLNWFSKTSIIGWNRISWPRALAIIALWMASLWIYSIDVRTGLIILMTLSFAHGFLELPLDHQTFFNLFKEMWALAHGSFGKAQPSAQAESKFAA